LATRLAVVPQKEESSSSFTTTSSTTTTVPDIPPLADQVRHQTSFRNPRHVVETAITALHLRTEDTQQWFGSQVIATSISTTELEPWEYNVVRLEEEARRTKEGTATG
jgi:hypothetical protein